MKPPPETRVGPRTAFIVSQISMYHFVMTGITFVLSVLATDVAAQAVGCGSVDTESVDAGLDGVKVIETTE